MIQDRQHGLKSDELGFLVGQRRLERVSKDIHADTQEIVRILRMQWAEREANPPQNQLVGLSRAIAEISARQTKDVVKAIRNTVRVPLPTMDVGPAPVAQPVRATRDVRSNADLNSPSTTTPQANGSTPSNVPPTPATANPNSPSSDPARGIEDSLAPTATPEPTPRRRGTNGRFERDGDVAADGRVNNGRRRGANGRFEGDGEGKGGDKDKSWFKQLRDALSSKSGSGLGIDPKGVDPTVDAINELGTLLSPMKKAAGFALKPVTALWRMRKRKEPLSRDEEEHNREQLRVLRDIARQRRAQGGMGGMMGMVRLLPIALLAAAPLIGKAIWNAMKGGGDSDNGGEQPQSKPVDGSQSSGLASGFVSNGQTGVQVALDANGPLSQLIASGEGDYQSFNRGNAGDSSKEKIDFSKLSMKDILTLSTLPKGHKDRIFAAGKYQIIPDTLRGAIQSMGLNENDAFTPELQERIFREYLVGSKRKRLKGVLNGRSDDLEGAAYDASREFASLAVPRGRKTKFGRVSDGTMGYYDGDKAKNKASISADRVMEAIRQERDLRAKAQKAKDAPKPLDANTPTIKPIATNEPATSTRAMADSLGQTSIDSMLKQETKTVRVMPPMKAATRGTVKPLAMPALVPIKERLDSGKDRQMMTAAQPSDSISQNVGDRSIAHAVTGGLGMRTWES
jgi:hypothetical protein